MLGPDPYPLSCPCLARTLIPYLTHAWPGPLSPILPMLGPDPYPLSCPCLARTLIPYLTHAWPGPLSPILPMLGPDPYPLCFSIAVIEPKLENASALTLNEKWQKKSGCKFSRRKEKSVRIDILIRENNQSGLKGSVKNNP
jgi:hypothetical protein